MSKINNKTFTTFNLLSAGFDSTAGFEFKRNDSSSPEDGGTFPKKEINAGCDASPQGGADSLFECDFERRGDDRVVLKTTRKVVRSAVRR